MDIFRNLFQRRIALALVSALAMGGLSVGVILMTAPSASPAATSSAASSSTSNASTGTTSASRLSSSDDGANAGETRQALSGVVQQADTGTGQFILNDRRGSAWTAMVTPNTQFMGISPSQIQPGRRLVMQGTVQSNGTLLAASVLANRDD